MYNCDIICNNCGKNGHQFYQCKLPITSFGVVAFRRTPMRGEHRSDTSGVGDELLTKTDVPDHRQYEYLMIRRKDTLGYIDFLRGKYTLHNKNYIMNMFKQMTVSEKTSLRNGNFLELWKNLWGISSSFHQYKSEELSSMEKYNSLKAGVIIQSTYYTLDALLDESNNYPSWTEPEWGFPKGRRNRQEKDYDCAIREFSEETGYNKSVLQNIHNILPYEETFSGSNYKSYKHKYYLMKIEYADSLQKHTFEHSEVSDIGWKTIDNCIACIRPYNLEKISMISKIHECLTKHAIYSS